MAESRIVQALDEKLIRDGIMLKEYTRDYRIVHDMLNIYMRRNRGRLPKENFDKGERKLRDWLMILYKKGASQEKLTSYLRCGLGHLSFDFIVSKNPDMKPDDLVYRSLQSFKQRGFHKTFFKMSPTKEDKRISLKK